MREDRGEVEREKGKERREVEERRGGEENKKEEGISAHLALVPAVFDLPE